MAVARILASPLGIVALDGDKIVGFRSYGNDLDEIAKVYLNLQNGVLPSNINELLKELSDKGYSSLAIEDQKLFESLSKLAEGVTLAVEYVEPEPIDLESLFLKNGLVGSREEYEQKVKMVCDAVLALSLKVAISRRDVLIIPAVHAHENIEKQINMIYMGCREWYGIHFPELNDLVDDPEDYLKIVTKIGLRDRMDEESLSKVIPGHKRLKDILTAKEKSVGASLLEQDEEYIKRFAEEGLRLIQLRKDLENYIKSLMSLEAPNLTAIAGPILGSKLLAMAGGLERLARMPASTIQVLGAEKALFRFLKTGRGAPKHGLIFQHPYVHTSPKWQRGKIARVLAAKISIAARIDYFSREDRSAELRKALEERIKEIKTKYAEPPKREKKVKKMKGPRKG
jgi:nucleolar protein 56